MELDVLILKFNSAGWAVLTNKNTVEICNLILNMEETKINKRLE